MKWLLTLIILSGLSPAAWSADNLSEAVAAYRQGQYSRAYDSLEQLHKQTAVTAKSLYYQAITEAQLGKLDASATHYQQIMANYPGTPEAQLAETGLNSLHTLGQPELDAPPGGNIMSAKLNPAMTAEQLQFQGIMGLMGGNQNGNQNTNPTDMNLWNSLLGQQGNRQTPATDPQTMSTMLMNQWMGQMDMGGGNRDDR